MRLRLLSILVLLLIGLAALPAVSSAQSSQARIRVMHASPDAPAVDVYLANTRVLADLTYFSQSQALSVPGGTYRVQVTPAGQPVSAAVIDTSLTVEAGREYTLAAVNTLAQIEPLVLVDNNRAPPAGLARVRIVHAAPLAPAVDLKLSGTNTPVVSTLEFKGSAFIEVPAGRYRFDVTPSGSSFVLYVTPEMRFEAGWVYTLTASGFFGQSPVFWVQSRVDRISP